MTMRESSRGATSGGHEPSGKRYVIAWLALLVLTALSFAADHLVMGNLATAVALGVALIKASVVLVVFMHIGQEPFPIRFVAVLNLAWVALLCLGIAADTALLGAFAPGAP